MAIANTMHVRFTNTQTILHELEIQQTTTNLDIAIKHNLSVPTVTNIVSILKTNGMITSAGSKVSSGGRRPTLISLNSEYHYFIGLNILKHVVYAVLINFKGQVLDSKKFFYDFEISSSYWEYIHEISKSLSSQINSDIPVDIGIAFPGTVDLENERITGTETLGMPSVDISGLLNIMEYHLELNDSARSAGLAQLFGTASYPDSVYLLMSRRIAGVLIINNKIFQLSNSDCSFGSMILSENHNDTEYGLPGSFVSFCSSSRIIDTMKSQNLTPSYEYFFSEINAGNVFLTSVWNDFLNHLSTALHNIYCVFGTHIVIGGEMEIYLRPYFDQLANLIQQKYSINYAKELLHFSTYGQYDDAIGAALYARTNVLNTKVSEALKTTSD